MIWATGHDRIDHVKTTTFACVKQWICIQHLFSGMGSVRWEDNKWKLFQTNLVTGD